MAGRKTVRPIHISDNSFLPLYRFEGSQESSPTSEPCESAAASGSGPSPHAREDAKRPTSGAAIWLARRVAATRPQGRGGSRARTLKTAQGRHSEEARKRGRFQSEARTCGNSQIRLLSHLNSLRNGEVVEARSSEEERRVDAKALIADEGRDKLRKAAGSCK